MCLILFAYHMHSKFPLIVAANRDEFFRRPTAPARFWEGESDILAGRDLEKGGTWMGVSKSGRFAALTNYRDPSEDVAGKRSRGELVTGALNFSGSVSNFFHEIAKQDALYPGYNLLAGDTRRMFYYSNREGIVKELTPGIYGLSNHLLNTPWPKVEKGRKELAKIIDQKDEVIAPLFQLLSDGTPFPDDRLPSTGVSLEMERMLSPLFIRGKDYGTRSSTVLLMSDSTVDWIEKPLQPEKLEENRYKFVYTLKG